MKPTASILIVEDDASIAAALKQALAAEGYRTNVIADGREGLESSRTASYDVVMTDLKLPGLSGLDLVRELHQSKPLLPVILMTAYGTTDTAIQATKLGAFDYLVKPFDMGDLLNLIEKAVASRRSSEAPARSGGSHPIEQLMVGNSAKMQSVYKEIGRVAARPVTVLIRGESGTGKELVARAVHQYSDRNRHPFVVVNSTAIPETLLESELFGHERGAFTGADVQRIGRFEQANHGTIFLDEIGDISPSTQAKLLRVLQEKTIRRLGGKEPIPVDVRIIAATNRNLEKAIQEKLFREDLYYRLNVFVIQLPPLREHCEDIASLSFHFLQRYASALGFPDTSISVDAIQLLEQHPWPGNIRELENVIHRAILLARGYLITPEIARSVMVSKNSVASAEPASLGGIVADLLERAAEGGAKEIQGQLIEMVERELYAQAIRRADGNQARTAQWLGVSRPTLHDKLVKYGLLAPSGKTADRPRRGK